MKLPKLTKTMMVGVASLLIAPAVSAYGPERDTYTMQLPANHPVFNSITDNPALGDERNFVRIREVGQSTFVDEVEIEPGKEYEVYIYYHNNAASNLNAGGTGIASGVKVASTFPGKVKKGTDEQVTGAISATNTDPVKVWDEAKVSTKYDEVLLSYKDGSATIHNSDPSTTNDSILSQDIFTEDGTYIGSLALDGVVLGCGEYSGYITYVLEAKNIGAHVDKYASANGEEFAKSVTIEKGATVFYKVVFKNTGTIELNNVTFRDVLPEGLKLVKDTTKLVNLTNPNGIMLGDLLVGVGYNTGKYEPGATAEITYKATADKCGKLTNRFFVEHSNGEISDTADVEVTCSTMPSELPQTGISSKVVLVVLVSGAVMIGGVFVCKSNKKSDR